MPIGFLGFNPEVLKPSEMPAVAQVHQAQLLRPSTWAGSRRDGLVAVKIQYPDALVRMLQDLVNIRVAARFLQVSTCPPPRACTR